jgi:hypothetical protein
MINTSGGVNSNDECASLDKPVDRTRPGKLALATRLRFATSHCTFPERLRLFAVETRAAYAPPASIEPGLPFPVRTYESTTL